MKFDRPHIMQIRSTPDTHSDPMWVPELMIAADSPTAQSDQVRENAERILQAWETTAVSAEHDQSRPGRAKLVILDEASTTSMPDLADIVQHAARSDAKLVILGNDAQLGAVEIGSATAPVARSHPQP